MSLGKASGDLELFRRVHSHNIDTSTTVPFKHSVHTTFANVIFFLSYSRLTTYTSSTRLFTTTTKSRVISGVIHLYYLHLLFFNHRQLRAATISLFR